MCGSQVILLCGQCSDVSDSVTISDLAISNFLLLLYDVAYEVSPSHGPAMAYMSHGRANAESLLEFMDSRRQPMSEILVIFLGQLTSAKVGDSSPTFL